MTLKRAADEETPSANGVDSDGGRSDKRQRTSSSAPHTENWRQPQLTPEQRKKLVEWLDKLAAQNEDPFVIKYPKASNKPTARGKKGHAAAKKPEKGNVRHETLKLEEHEYGQVAYTISNRERWDMLTKYRRCTVSEQTFVLGGCVFVRSDEEDDQANGTADETLSQWKAQILEVRALDENHVYLRVAWLYRPQHDLPGGPLPHHGKYELIPSTEMQIIDAKTINGLLNIKRWDEYNENDVHNASEYFWRQSYAHTRGALSPLRTMCACGRPQNPDRPITQCARCNEWLHAKCIEQDALDRYLAAHADEKVTDDDDDGHSNGDTKTTTKTKAARTSNKDLTSKTEANNVLAEFKTEDAGQAPLVIITDSRSQEPKSALGEVRCVACTQKLE